MANELSAEDRLIARFFAPLATHPGALGLTDDAAFITPPPGCDLVLKTDAIIGGVHFFPDDAAQTIASKALRVNLSDLAAKGAKPLGFLLSLALPKDITDTWLANFAEGLRSDAVLYGCPLFGGDTDRTPGPLTVSIAMFGSVPQGTMVRRAGAKPGDRVFVTGTIGDAALGLAVRKGRDCQAHRRAAPASDRALSAAAAAQRARRSRAHACLRRHGRLRRACRRFRQALPRLAGRRRHRGRARAAVRRRQAVIAADPAMLETALTGGDDYEIVCTVPPAKADGFRAAAAAAKVPVTEIGAIEAGEGARFLDAGGQPLTFARASFSHF